MTASRGVASLAAKPWTPATLEGKSSPVCPHALRRERHEDLGQIIIIWRAGWSQAYVAVFRRIPGAEPSVGGIVVSAAERTDQRFCAQSSVAKSSRPSKMSFLVSNPLETRPECAEERGDTTGGWNPNLFWESSNGARAKAV